MGIVEEDLRRSLRITTDLRKQNPAIEAPSEETPGERTFSSKLRMRARGLNSTYKEKTYFPKTT